ncbi:unnamed protein product [Bursaphelenchus okinawaensis]|uniref:Glycosyltransferase family 92 protein n=1 Tax=Bursaphelenchus okinawaensis TaxID=465554 RepID=A0A811LQC5_9BILA|nr:unnamed protein product [Bursaphelenchus okinawaensis]CAG9127799.1 unnamed protein product [Bursaphelenchus okinawaensis]
MHNQLIEMFRESEDFPTMRPINHTFEEIDSKKYIQDLINGKAEVAPVVEQEKYPEIYFGCSMEDTKNVSRGWVENGRWYLYSAYEDIRSNSLYPKLKSVIQIIASTYFVVDDQERWYCHIRNVNGEMLRVRAHFRLIWQRAWDSRRTFYNPYLITCALPNDYVIYKGAVVMLRGRKCPSFNETFLNVNLVKNAEMFEDNNSFKMAKPPVFHHKSQNIVKIVDSLVRNRYERVKQEQQAQSDLHNNIQPDANSKTTVNEELNLQNPLKIAVCVKGMDFYEDKTLELAQWLILQYTFGADSVTLYIYHLHERTREMLKEFSKEYDLRVIDIDLPGNFTLSDQEQHSYIWNNYSQKRRNELIPYNDCFYSYAHTHDYVLIVDTDEVVVPLEHESWNEMIKHFISGFRQNATSLSVRNVFKFPNEDDDEGLMGRRTRASIIQEKGISGKSFISTQTAATVFNHFALHRLHGNVARTAYFPPSTALKLHYKTDCPRDFAAQCEGLKNSSIPDHSLDRWRETVVKMAHDIVKRV